MSSNDHRTFLTSKLNKPLEAIDKLPLHPKIRFTQNLRNVKSHSYFVYEIQLMLKFDVFAMKQVKL